MSKATATPANRAPRGWRVPVEAYGALLILLGAVALLAPLLPPIAAGVTFGGLLVAAGVSGMVVLSAERSKGFVWRMLWLAVAALAGSAVLVHHWTGLGSLPWTLGVSLPTLGVIAVGHILSRRGAGRFRWRWTVIGAFLTIGLGGLLVVGAPHAGLMLLGLFLAINFAVFGLSLVVAGLVGRASALLL
jgi:uncharacterized membrane protein HdeD (DUF308 family)